MKKIGLASLLTVACVAASMGFAAPAHAAPTNCHVISMYYANDFMQFTCNELAGNFSVYGPTTGCPAADRISSDAMKIWVSMVQSAYLSGRQIQFDFTTNGCPNAVKYIELTS